MAPRTIMHIDLDAFFASVEQVLNPELKGKPVVVGGNPERRGVVAAASYEARACGIHAGMPLITASRRCPQAVFIEGHFKRYREASKKFMAILADFSPFLEPAGLDEAYLDVTGFESLHGSIKQMAVKIRKRIKDEVGLAASVGIASSKVIAKVASGQAKPDGIIEVNRGEESRFLSPLPIAKLPGVGKKTEQKLKSLGITSIGQLSLAPISTLKSYFGASGEVLWRYARGIDNRKITPPGPPKSISRETTFPADTRDRIFLEATLRYLSEKVGAELRYYRKKARSVTLKTRYADFTTTTRSYTFSQAASTDQAIFDSGRRLLIRALTADKQSVRLIGIGVSNLVEAATQLAMMDQSAQRLEHLNRTVDHIRDRYGFSAIQTGKTLKLKDIYR